MGFHSELIGTDLHEPTIFRVTNNTGSTLTSLRVVKSNNYNAPFVQVLPITATSDRPVGVVINDILDTENGEIVNVGILSGVDTSGFGAGSDVFSDASGNLTLSDTGLFIGTVLISDSVNGVIFINIAAQGSAGVAGASATVGVVLVTPTQATAQASIGAALASANANDAVVVGPGTYNESVTIPADVTLIAPYGAGTALITGALATGTRITLSAGSILRGFSVNLPTDASAAVLLSVAGSANVIDGRLNGQGGSGVAFQNSGLGTLLVDNIRYNGDCDVVFLASGGGTTVVINTGLQSGTINDAARVSGGATLTINNSGLFTTLSGTDGIEVADGFVRLNSVNIEGVTNAFHVTDNAADVRLQATLLEGQDFDLLVDSALTGVGTLFFASGANFSSAKFDVPAVWFENARVGLTFFDVESSPDTTLRVVNELSVGTAFIPSKINAGGGDAYIAGYRVLRNTNLDAGTWSEITDDVVTNPGGTPVQVFPGSGSNNTFYAGGDLEFFGLKMVTTTAIVLGTGSIIWEFWNGATWTEVSVMATEIASPLDQYGNDTFGRAQGEHISFSMLPGWTQNTLNGINKYWVRCRITSPISTVPQIDETKLLPDRLKVGLKGEISLFGGARVERLLPWDLTFLVDIVGASPGNSNVDVSASINLALTDNQLTNGVVDSRGGIIQVPFGLDTSVPLKLSIEWYPNVATGGNVELEVDFAIIRVGDVLNGTLPETRISQVIAAPNVANETVRTEFELLVDTVVPGDFIALRIFRDATGGNGDDTLVGNVILFGTFLAGNFWK